MDSAISTKCFHVLREGFNPNDGKNEKTLAECPVFFIGCEGLNDGESCPREGESVRDKSLPQFVKVHWRGLRD